MALDGSVTAVRKAATCDASLTALTTALPHQPPSLEKPLGQIGPIGVIPLSMVRSLDCCSPTWQSMPFGAIHPIKPGQGEFYDHPRSIPRLGLFGRGCRWRAATGRGTTCPRPREALMPMVDAAMREVGLGAADLMRRGVARSGGFTGIRSASQRRTHRTRQPGAPRRITALPRSRRC